VLAALLELRWMNIFPGNGAAYGTYLADVIAHFRSQGININLVSPMNEPDSNFGPSPCGQEGMQVLPSQYEVSIYASGRH
jgi:O-glycosyl hydrolase